MTAMLKLVYTADIQSDQDSIDLLYFNAGFSLVENGWTPKIATANQDSIIETITLAIHADTQDGLAAAIHTLETWIQKVNYSHDGAAKFQVWLRAKDTFESSARQAMIIEMSGIVMDAHPTLNFDTKDSDSKYKINQYVLTIRRTPYWEMPYPYPTTTSLTAISTIGDSSLIAETINGDVPARLVKVTLTPYPEIPDTPASPLRDYWLGWRTSRFGTLANFIPAWTLKDASTRSADTSVVANPFDLGGVNVLKCTFGSSTDTILRATIQTNDVTVNHNDQRGTFNVLLRAGTDGLTTQANLYLRYGLGAGQIKRAPVIVSTDSVFTYYELGVVQMPYMQIRNVFSLKYFGLSLYAGLVAGAGNLYLDRLILIPVDESSVKTSLYSQLDDSVSLLLNAQPDEGYTAFGAEASNPTRINHTADIYPMDWSLPVNNEQPLLVAAAKADSVSVYPSAFNFEYVYIPRWRGLRGNQT